MQRSPRIRSVRIEHHFLIIDGELVQNYASQFKPSKGILVVYLDGRATLKVSGYLPYGQARTISYNVWNYDRYPACPEWLHKFLRAAAYTGPIIDEEE